MHGWAPATVKTYSFANGNAMFVLQLEAPKGRPRCLRPVSFEKNRFVLVIVGHAHLDIAPHFDYVAPVVVSKFLGKVSFFRQYRDEMHG